MLLQQEWSSSSHINTSSPLSLSSNQRLDHSGEHDTEDMDLSKSDNIIFQRVKYLVTYTMSFD